MNSQQKEFTDELFKKFDTDDQKGIEKYIRSIVKEQPGKISLVPTSLRTLNICKFLVANCEFGYQGVKKYIPRPLRSYFESGGKKV